MKKVYASIDIGSDTIKFVVGELFNGEVNVLAAHSIKSKGIRKGLIIDPNLCVNAIKDGMKEINNMLGIVVKKVIVNVPDYNAKFMLVNGECEIENSDSIITNEDINKVIKTSVYGKLPANYELVTVLPIFFSTDEKDNVLKPLGMQSKKIGVKGIMISVPKKNVYSVLGVMEGAGLEVIDITLNGLCNYYESRNNDVQKKVGAVINIGHETTNVSIFNKGILMNTETIQIGGNNIDKDIECIFGVNVFDARNIKEKFASSHKRFCQLAEVYEIKNNYGELIRLNQLEVTEVVMKRLIEILEFSKKQIKLLTKSNINYIVITGGLTEIKSFKNLVYEYLGKNTIIHTVDTIGVRDNKYSTALGMINYFIDKMEIRGNNYSMISTVDEEMLITPDSNSKKDDTIINKLFSNFMGNKEEK